MSGTRPITSLETENLEPLDHHDKSSPQMKGGVGYYVNWIQQIGVIYFGDCFQIRWW